MPVKKVAKKMTTKQMKKTKGGASVAVSQDLLRETVESKRRMQKR